jgi:hypothetical protein
MNCSQMRTGYEGPGHSPYVQIRASFYVQLNDEQPSLDDEYFVELRRYCVWKPVICAYDTDTQTGPQIARRYITPLFYLPLF